MINEMYIGEVNENRCKLLRFLSLRFVNVNAYKGEVELCFIKSHHCGNVKCGAAGFNCD